MKVRFVWAGRTKKEEISRLVAEYVDRISHFARVEVVQVRDRGERGSKVADREGEALLRAIGSDPFVVVLDQHGHQLDSNELASLVERHGLSGTKQITFVVGGFDGISRDVCRRADMLLALSKMTLSHEMARLVMVEQVYRAFAILHRLPYPK